MAGIKKGDKEGFLWILKNGETATLEKYIEQDSKLVNASVKSRYPLHHAADFGQVEIVRCLLENNANINQKDDFGITPLLAAIYENHVECVKLLLEKGADKTAMSPNGKSYIDCAESEAVRNLLK